jgi:hypothetical protein
MMNTPRINAGSLRRSGWGTGRKIISASFLPFRNPGLREGGGETGKKPGRNSMLSSRRRPEGGVPQQPDDQAISVTKVRLILREVF